MTEKEFISTVAQQWEANGSLPNNAQIRTRVSVGGNRGDLAEGLREGNLSAIFQGLCQIDDLAKAIDLYPGSFARQGQKFAREMIAKLETLGISRGEHVWEQRNGRVLDMGRWQYFSPLPDGAMRSPESGI